MYLNLYIRENMDFMFLLFPMRRVCNPYLGHSQTKSTQGMRRDFITWITVPLKPLIMLYEIDTFIFLATQ